MRTFLEEHPKEGRKLNVYIRRIQSNGHTLDKPHVKREIGRFMKVNPDWVERKIQAKLTDPVIIEQIDTAKRVYQEAREVLANLHKRKDAASGVITSPLEPQAEYKMKDVN